MKFHRWCHLAVPLHRPKCINRLGVTSVPSAEDVVIGEVCIPLIACYTAISARLRLTARIALAHFDRGTCSSAYLHYQFTPSSRCNSFTLLHGSRPQRRARKSSKLHDRTQHISQWMITPTQPAAAHLNAKRNFTWIFFLPTEMVFPLGSRARIVDIRSRWDGTHGG